MSETALCAAVVDQIKTVLTTPNLGWIDVRPNGEPPSSGVGDVFVAVHSEGWTFTGFSGDGGYIRNSGTGLHNAMCEEFYINVTVSVKVSQNHKAFWGAQLNMNWENSLSYAVRGVINAIHCQPDVVSLANSRIETAISSPIIEMLRAMRVEPKRERKADWWGSTTTATSRRVEQVVGYSQTISFFGGKRIQNVGNYT